MSNVIPFRPRDQVPSYPEHEDCPNFGLKGVPVRIDADIGAFRLMKALRSVGLNMRLDRLGVVTIYDRSGGGQ